MDPLVINGLQFNLKITHRPVSSLKLKLISRDEIEVVCHSLTPKFIINNFIKQHHSWIINSSQKIAPKTNFLNLKELNVLDKKYKIIINKTSQDSVIISETEQTIFINSSILSTSHVKQILELRLRRLARVEINKSLIDLKEKWGFVYQKVCIKNQSSRFGSCSSLGNLNFNWQIVLFPYEQFVHVLLHELNHLKIKNHQAEFWYQLSLYDKNCFKNNKYLKKTGKDLLIFS